MAVVMDVVIDAALGDIAVSEEYDEDVDDDDDDDSDDVSAALMLAMLYTESMAVDIDEDAAASV